MTRQTPTSYALLGIRRGVAIALAVIGTVAVPTAARADVVTDWNFIATQAILVANARQGPAGTIDLAMVHVAMHDAIQAFEHRFDSYGEPIADASGSPVAAAAAAAHDVLVGVGLVSVPIGANFPPGTTVDSLYNDYLKARSLLNDDGLSAGH